MKQSFRQRVIIITMLVFFSFMAKPIYAEPITLNTSLTLEKLEKLEKLDKYVVAIGYKRFILIDENGHRVNMNATGKGKIVRIPLGAGVLVQTDRRIIVTAKHVVFENDGRGKVISDLYIWGNRNDGSEFEYFYPDFQKKWGNMKWIKHSDPNVDIAASIIGLSKEDQIDFIKLKDIKEFTKLKKGEVVYYLGFPLLLGADYGSNPVLRKGMVALKEKGKKFFILDAVLAKGNSGGPAFNFEKETLELLGIISAFQYQLTEKGLFHSGLGIVYSSECIKEIIESKEFKMTY